MVDDPRQPPSNQSLGPGSPECSVRPRQTDHGEADRLAPGRVATVRDPYQLQTPGEA
jgi:hypothetical protein